MPNEISGQRNHKVVHGRLVGSYHYVFRIRTADNRAGADRHCQLPVHNWQAGGARSVCEVGTTGRVCRVGCDTWRGRVPRLPDCHASVSSGLCRGVFGAAVVVVVSAGGILGRAGRLYPAVGRLGRDFRCRFSSEGRGESVACLAHLWRDTGVFGIALAPQIAVCPSVRSRFRRTGAASTRYWKICGW